MTADPDVETSLETIEPLAVLAHELRNPISAIRNAVLILESAATLPGALDRARRVIARQAGQLSLLVEDVMELARFTRGTLNLKPEWVDIVSEVEAAVESCAWALNGSGHDFCLALPSKPLYGLIDGPRVQQVITNLLDNACKYTPAFGRIKLSVEHAGDRAVFSVEDNGAGIASERLPYVFDLFTRSKCPRDLSAQGLGIGLALVREIAERHGGEVHARSNGVGLGSVFIVELPIRGRHLDAADLEHAPVQPGVSQYLSDGT